MDKLDKLQTLGRGTWVNTGVSAVSAPAGNGSVVMYWPYVLPRA